MKIRLSVILAITFIAILTPYGNLHSSDTESSPGHDWIFNPPESFLGSSPTHQTDYITGMLDTLYHIRQEGPPEDRITDCIFDDVDRFRIISLTSSFTNLVTNDRVESGDSNFSVVSELFRQLEDECQLGIFR